jgi:hypothetical protein
VRLASAGTGGVWMIRPACSSSTATAIRGLGSAEFSLFDGPARGVGFAPVIGLSRLLEQELACSEGVRTTRPGPDLASSLRPRTRCEARVQSAPNRTTEHSAARENYGVHSPSTTIDASRTRSSSPSRPLEVLSQSRWHRSRAERLSSGHRSSSVIDPSTVMSHLDP